MFTRRAFFITSSYWFMRFSMSRLHTSVPSSFTSFFRVYCVWMPARQKSHPTIFPSFEEEWRQKGISNHFLSPFCSKALQKRHKIVRERKINFFNNWGKDRRNWRGKNSQTALHKKIAEELFVNLLKLNRLSVYGGNFEKFCIFLVVCDEWQLFDLWKCFQLNNLLLLIFSPLSYIKLLTFKQIFDYSLTKTFSLKLCIFT